MDELKIREPSIDIVEPSQQCSLCHTATARYTCPRCNVRYCTLECYRCEAHSQCSELFYRDCFVEGLRDMEADDEEKKRMMAMLQRFEEQDVINNQSSSGDTDEDDPSDELSKIDLDKASDVDIWQRLPAAEKREFAAMLKDGRIGGLVQTWDPWWLVVPRLITDIGDKTSKHPAILDGFEDMGRKLGKLSPTIRFGIVSSLYSYAYVARLYNGDHCTPSLAGECSQVIVAMFTNCLPTDDVASAVAGCLKSVEQLEAYFVSREFSISVISDVTKLVACREYVMAALSDDHAMMCLAKKEKAGKTTARRSRVEVEADRKEAATHRHQCFQVMKKLEFYLAWIYANGDLLCALAPVLELEHLSLLSELTAHGVDKRNVQKLLADKKSRSSRKLIEEIDNFD